MWIHLTIPFTVVFCADRFGLGQPGRMPASVNAMRVLSTSTDLEAAVADALVRGKIQNASNTGKWLKVTCTYVLLFLSSFILIVPVSDAVGLPLAGLTLGILAAVCFPYLCPFSAAVIRQSAVAWYCSCRMDWISCLLFTWLSENVPSTVTVLGTRGVGDFHQSCYLHEDFFRKTVLSVSVNSWSGFSKNMFLPWVIFTWVDTQRAHNFACMESVPSHAVMV